MILVVELTDHRANSYQTSHLSQPNLWPIYQKAEIGEI